MKKSISGAGFTISGVLLWILAMSGLDWRRVRDYGLMHEVGLYSEFLMIVFWMGTIFIILGVILMLLGAFEKPYNNEYYN
jgi:hypothetical protein